MSFYRVYEIDNLYVGELNIQQSITSTYPSAGTVLYTNGSGGTFWSSATAASGSNYFTLSTGTITVSSIAFIDSATTCTLLMMVSSHVLYLDGSTIQGGGNVYNFYSSILSVSTSGTTNIYGPSSNITTSGTTNFYDAPSTVITTGTTNIFGSPSNVNTVGTTNIYTPVPGFLSTFTLSTGNLFASSINLIDGTTRSTGFISLSSGVLKYNNSNLIPSIANLVSTSYLTTQLGSTVIGLGTAGYISSLPSLANLVSTANLTGLVSTANLTGLVSTANLTGLVSTANLTGLVSTANLTSLVSTANLTNLVSTANLTNLVSTANLTGLVSTANLANLVSTANFTGLVSTANLANLVSTANLANLVSTANLANLVSTANLANLVSTANLANLVSTANLANLVSTANLANLVSTANLANLVSTSYFNSQLISTVIGLGTAGYISTSQLTSTTAGTFSYISSFVSSAISDIPFYFSGEILYMNYTITVGSYHALENTSLANTSGIFLFTVAMQTTDQFFIGFETDFTLPIFITEGYWKVTLFSMATLQAISLYANIYLKSSVGVETLLSSGSLSPTDVPTIPTPIDLLVYVPYTTIPTGATIVIKIFANNSLNQNVVLTTYYENGHYSHVHTTIAYTIPNLSITSSLIGLGTMGYLSTVVWGSVVSTANLANLVSTSYLNTQVGSTVVGLGTVGYLSSIPSLGGFVSTANLANIVSTSALNAAVTSTVIGLGTVGYISSAVASLPGGLVSTANLANLVSTNLLNTSLTSTVIGLGTAGYVSSSQLLSTSKGIQNTLDSIGILSTTQAYSYSTGVLYTSSVNFYDPRYSNNARMNVSAGILLLNGISVSGITGGGSGVTQIIAGANISVDQGTGVVTITGPDLNNYVSTSYTADKIGSTVIGLGTAGYISTAQFLSTTYSYSRAFTTLSANISTLYFSTATANTAYISSLTIDQLTFGDGNGWADFGALRATVVSSYQVNTGIVYAPIISTSLIVGVNFLTQANLTSTVIGLGTTGYLSSIPSLGGFVSTANLAGHVSTANLATLVSTSYLTTQLGSTVIGLGTTGYLSSIPSLGGFVSTANLANLVSTANLATLVSTSYLTTQLGSTVIGLGTTGYLSSIPSLGGFVSTANLAGHVSTANLATLVSTSYLTTQLGSTVIGLGTTGYLSSIPSLGGFVSTANLAGHVSTANLATLVSTSYLTTQLGSTVIGLGTTGYLSSIPSLGGFVSTANLANLVSTANLAGLISSANLTSTVIGLGTAGYISSSQFLSTTYGYSQNFITQNASVSSLRFSTATGGNAYISTLTIDQLIFGDGNGWSDFAVLRAVAVSTLQINTGIIYATTVSTSQLIGINYITPANLTSTVVGLGTVGYLSSASASINASGLVSTANLANLVSTANLANLVSTANLANIVSTANLANIVSTANLTNLVSTANLANLVSTANLANIVSTANLANIVSTANLAGHISTANLANLVSTTYLASQLGSTVIGLGTAGYISSGQLISTTAGLSQYISSFIDPTELTSTIIGLGTAGFVSSLGLTYAVASTAQGLGTFGYTSTSQLLSTSLGLYQQIQTSATTIVQQDVTSTITGLGTFGYISTIVWGSVVSTANLANLVSTANLANLVSTANLANLVSTANLANLVSTANLTNLVSTTYLATQITSTVIGLGTVGYLSTVLQASFMRGSRSAAQTTNITAGCNVVFTQVDASAGGDISLNTGTGVITLAANRTYRLIGSVPNLQASGGSIAMQWSNIGVGVVGSLQSYYAPANNAAFAASGSESEYIFSPSVTTTVAFIVVNNNSVTQLGNNTDFSVAGSYPWFEIQVIGGLAPYTGPALTNIVSTSFLNYAITSTVIGLGTAGYLSSATSAIIPSGLVSTANLANLISTANLATLVSTSYLATQLGSTVIGLGTSGYISSSQLLSTSIGLSQYISTFIDTTELTSTVIGLGTTGFVSSLGLTYAVASTAQGLGTFGYTSTSQLLSTSLGLYQEIQNSPANIKQSNVTSTIIGLGTFGYISTIVWGSVVSTANLAGHISTANLANLVSTANLANLVSTANLANLVSTANLATLVSTSYLATQLGSTVRGLGTAGYLSSINYSTVVLSSLTAQNLTSVQGYISSLTVDALYLGSNSAFFNMGDVIATSLSTIQINVGTEYAVTISAQQLYVSSILATNIIGALVTANLTSTVIGLGTTGYLSSIPSLGGFVSTANLANLVSTANLANHVSTSYLATQLGSTVIGLGTAGYLSSIPSLGGFVSTANLANIVSTANLANHISTANLATLVSTSYLATQLGSTVIGLGTAGYISSGQLLSTSVGLSQYISSFIDPTELTSTVIGLGTQGFVSSLGLTYAVASTAQGLGTFGYTSTSQLLSTSLGLYQEIQTSATNIVQADVTSTITGLGTFGYLSTIVWRSVVSTANLANLVSTSYLNTSITSTVIGLGTTGYISSIPSIGGFVSTANLANLVSTANLANLVSTANLANLVSTANLANLVSTANLGNLVSTSYLNTSHTSTVIGLGTAGYVSTSQLLSTTIGIYNKINSLSTGTTSLANYAQNTVGSRITVPLAGPFPYTVVSATITTGGNPVQVIATGDAENTTPGGWGIIQLYRGTTAIGGQNNFEGSAASENSPFGITWIDAVPAGNYTYSLKVSTLAGGDYRFGETTSPVISVVEIGGSSPGYLSSLSLFSTVAGLGTAGYLSSASLYSTVTGLGTAGYLSSIPSLGGFVSTANLANLVSTSFLNTSLTSTVIGLGTAGYLSSIPSLGGFVSTANLANLVSTSFLNTSLTSTVIGLGTAGYLSSIPTLGGFVSTANLANLVSTSYLNTSLTSSITGLGTAGYVSTSQLLSTSLGLYNKINSISTTTTLAPSGYVAQGTLPVNQTTPTGVDSIVGFVVSGSASQVQTYDPQNWWNPITSTLVPTVAGYYLVNYQVWWNVPTTTGQIQQVNIQIHKSPTSASPPTSTLIGPSLAIAQTFFPSTTTTGTSQSLTTMVQLNGTTEGIYFTAYNGNPTNTILRDGSYFNATLILSGNANYTSGFISTPTLNNALTSSITGLGTAGYLSSIPSLGAFGLVSTANFANIVSTANLANLVSTANLANLVSTANLANLVSTANLANVVSTSYLNTAFTSTVIGLGTAGYLSSALTNIGGFGLVSTANLAGHVSTANLAALVSTANLAALVSTTFLDNKLTSTVIGLGTAGYLSTTGFNASLTSTVIGLGTVGYISSQQLLSTTYGYSQNFFTLNATASTLKFSTATGGNAYISSLTIDQLTFGDGNGWADFGAIRAAVVSSYQVNTGIVYAPIISTSLIIGVSFLTQANLTSTVIGLGTTGYISSAITNLGGYGFVSTANLANLVSTANLAGHISTANLANLVSTANLANLVSTSYLQTQLGSTVIGLGTVGYLSTQISSFLTLSTGNLITSSITFNSPNSAPVGNNVFVSSSLFFFNQFVIGGTRVQQPQIFTF